MTRRSDRPVGGHGPGPIAALDRVQVRYRNGALGIVDVTMQVMPGQVVALLGANGAGKTTTVRALSGFLRTERARITSGSVRVAGIDVTGREPHEVCRLGISCVPERRKIFTNLSVAENLEALGTRLSRPEREAVDARIDALFPVLAARRHELAGRLSGGQQQMLAIARSLRAAPRLLIVDEMTLGLHHSLQPPLFQAVRDIAASGTAVLVVDESAGFALEVADHCYLLGRGRIVLDGPRAMFEGNELLAAGYVDAG